jgi:hypothetical protein
MISTLLSCSSSIFRVCFLLNERAAIGTIRDQLLFSARLERLITSGARSTSVEQDAIATSLILPIDETRRTPFAMEFHVNSPMNGHRLRMSLVSMRNTDGIVERSCQDRCQSNMSNGGTYVSSLMSCLSVTRCTCLSSRMSRELFFSSNSAFEVFD